MSHSHKYSSLEIFNFVHSWTWAQDDHRLSDPMPWRASAGAFMFKGRGPLKTWNMDLL